MSMPEHSFGNRVIYAIYLLVLAWAPIPLGSNRVWAWSLLEAIIYLLVALIVFFIGVSGKKVVEQSVLNRNRWIIILFGVQLVYLLIQCFPIPVELLSWISPIKADWFQNEPFILSPSFVTLTASVHHSMVEFCKQLAYVLMLCLTLSLVDSKKRFFITLSVIVGVSSLEAIYGIAAGLMGENFTFWRPTDGPYAGGTFVNKNHFAANLSFAVSLSIGLCMYFLRLFEFSPSLGKFRTLSIIITRLVLTPVGFTFGILLILISGIFLSQSKGALIALFTSVMLMLFVGASLHGKNSPERKVLPYILFIMLFASFWLGFGNIFSSFLIIDSPRLAHWQQTWNMFSEHWFLGVGNGSFQYVFTQYKDGEYSRYLIDYAHNDHLQLFAEQGIVGALLWYVALFLCFLKLFSSYRKKGASRSYQCLLLGCLIGLTTFFLHGFVDFNFHIPANALWFYTILGLGLVMSARINGGKWLNK